MANATITLYTGTTATLGLEDAETLTVAGNTVLRQRNQLAGASDTEIARVQATTPAGTEMGLVVRVAGPIPAGAAALGTVGVTSLIPGTAATSLGKAIDSAVAGTDTGVLALAQRRDALVTLTPADGDYVPHFTNSSGAVWVAFNEMLQAVGSLAHDAPDAGTATGHAFPLKIGGRATAALFTAVSENDRTDASFSLQGQLRTLVYGDIAHDDPDGGNPFKIGYKALAHGANPTAVAAADRSVAYSNRHGIPWVIGGHPNVITVEAAYTGAQTNAVVVAAVSTNRMVVTRCAVICANSNTVDVSVRVGFGAATTPTTTGVVLTHPGIAPGGGFSTGTGSGILGISGTSESLYITCSVPTTGSVRVLVSYYSVES